MRRRHEPQVLVRLPSVEVAQQFTTIKSVDQTKAVVANAAQNVVLFAHTPKHGSEGPGDRHHSTPSIHIPHLLEPRVAEQQTLAQALVRMGCIPVPNPVIVVIPGAPSDEQPPIRSQPHGVGAVELEAARDRTPPALLYLCRL